MENSKVGTKKGECEDVITSLHIEVYHAFVGSQGKKLVPEKSNK